MSTITLSYLMGEILSYAFHMYTQESLGFSAGSCPLSIHFAAEYLYTVACLLFCHALGSLTLCQTTLSRY